LRNVATCQAAPVLRRQPPPGAGQAEPLGDAPGGPPAVSGTVLSVTPPAAPPAGVLGQGLSRPWGTKPALLKAVFDVAVAGDDEPVPMLGRAGLGRVRDEPDPPRKPPLLDEVLAP